MKKRILSLLLALLTVLGSLPLMGAALEAELAPEVTACPACGTLGCTTEHLWCDICQKYDCGLVCYICTAHGCTTEHKYCEACGKYDCGVDHSFVGPLQLTNAAAAENGAAAPAPECTCGTETDTHAEDCPLWTKPAPQCTCGTESDTHAETCPLWTEPAAQPSLYDMLMATESMAAFEAVALASGNSYLELTEAEIIDLNDKIEELYASIANPSEGDTAKKNELFEMICLCPAAPVCDECGLFNAHTDTCSLKPAQDEGEGEACPDCGFADGLHAVDCASRCSCGENKPADGTHIGTCDLYTCPDCGVLLNQNGYVHDVNCGDEPEAPVTPDYSADIGKYAMIIESEESFFIADGPDHDAALPYYYYEFEDNTIFRIENVYWDGAATVMADGSELQASTALMYQISIAYGGPRPGVDWLADPWVLQDYTDESYPFEPALYFVDVSFCPDCGEPNCTKNHDTCPTCGSEGCTMNHFRPCEVCGSTQCSPHIYCYVCNKYDCDLTHKYCGSCKEYDCGRTHENPFAPLTAPIITRPAYSAGDVTISDRYGNVVNSLVLSDLRETLSAWGGYADYQWQVCYDAANNLWADIQGQSSQGIVLSPAMFRGAFSGGASIRCRSGSGDAATYSDPVAVSFADPATETFRSPVGTVGAVLPQADEGTGNLSTQQIVVQYKYDDGRTAASTAVAQIITGAAFSSDYELPSIPGYRAEVSNVSSYPGTVEIVAENGKNYLRVDFEANKLTEALTLIEVVFKPAPVKYTVIHYWQNIDNDYYTEHERQVVEAANSAYVTGQKIEKVQKSYPGFFNLLYDTPAAAADGSTVIEVYYDRYYYLMTFDLGTNGYGTEPIYARYGANLDIETPTRLGYTFKGWGIADAEGNVTATTVPATMPAGNMQYVAIWQPGDTAKVSIVVWGENANDEEYSYDKTVEIYLSPGTEFSYITCDKQAHIHNSTCYNCGLEIHTHTKDCYPNVGSDYRNRVSDGKAENGYIGIYRSWTGSSYYIYINGYWYIYNGNDGQSRYENDNPVQMTCNKTEHEEHTDSCIRCGLNEHTHDRDCYVYQYNLGMNDDRWILVNSDTVTVEADGSSRVDVYYDRKEYYVGFYSNQDCTDDKEYTSLRITAKWGADILNRWPTYNESSSWLVEGKSNTWQNSIQIMPVGGAKFWGPKTGNDSYSAYYYVEALPGTTVDTIVHNGITYILHHTDVSSSSGNVSDEERYGIEGFTYKEGTANNESYNNAKFYYTRNSYNLVFNDGYEDIQTYSVKYDAPLDEYMMLIPTAPVIYEPGSRVFAGWYLNPECTGEQVILTGKNMPAENIILYAKWELIEHKVNYYLDKDALDKEETIPEEMSRLYGTGETIYSTAFAEDTVKHGQYISDLRKPGVSPGYETIHRYAGYDFVAWFYIDDEGKENAFVPESMPVNRDLKLYAKWSSNKICQYNIYFALDANNDGVADIDDSGKVIYVADPLNGSGIAGNTYTFAAAGGEQLYNAYKEGYFPTVGSHSITIDINDEDGTITNHYTFLYQPQKAVPYGVRYLDKETGEELAKMYVNKDNTKIVVTEQFKYIPDYMPDEYQKTLVVTNAEDLVEDNIITFWYTKDTQHAIYVVNHYIQDLKADNTHGGWTKYTSLQSTGDIGTHYSADAISIDGFTLSADYTNGYNLDQKINGATGTTLPSVVTEIYGSNNSINGTLTDKGMELNFYYTRNFYPYEFRFVLKDLGTQLATPEVGVAPYDTVVVEQAKVISLDLDRDGILEEYRLYDATENEKEIRIKTDGAPLAAGATVAVGTATVNIATFEYIRCTADISVKKFVLDKGTDSHPETNQEYKFELKVHIADGYHKESYETQLDDGTVSTIYHELDRPDTICFTLRNYQNFTIKGLPTAQYTLTELPLPLGFTEPKYEYTIGSTVSTAADGSVVVGKTYSGNSEILQVEHPLHFTVTNTYDPAALEISKTVDIIEDLNTHEVEKFKVTIIFPDGVEVEDSYLNYVSNKKGNMTAVADKPNRTMSIELENGETARFANLPAGSYTVTETDYSAKGYKSNWGVNGGEHTEGREAPVTLVNGETQNVDFLNMFPVGDLIIEKTVSKEFFKTPWEGDIFTFTVERTNEGRPLKVGNQYKVCNEKGEELATATATVSDEKKLTVEIPFGEDDAAALETADVEVTHSYTIKNLPAGTYSVVENTDNAYNQTAGGSGGTVGSAPPSVSGLVLPAETVPTAEFDNVLIRPTGSLSLEKWLVRAAGFNEDELPQGTEFSFTISLTENVPDTVTVSKTYNDQTENVTMTAGTLEVKIKAGETVSFSGLPIGTYRITEQSIPSYANAFEVKYASGDWEKQDISAENGNLYTEVEVTVGDDPTKATEVRCTNVYPVERAQLIVSKDYTKEYDRDKLPEVLSSDFTVTFEEEDCIEYYYDVYNADGSFTKHTADVTPVSDGEDTDYAISFSLTDGQYAVITGGLTTVDADNNGSDDTVKGTPVCGYTVTETNANLTDFNVSYELFRSELENQIAADGEESAALASADAVSYTGHFLAGKLDRVEFTNEYKRHLGTITIIKNASGHSEGDYFIFHINGYGVDMDVAMDGPGSVTIYDVPIGDYTVTEDIDWSWRYTTSASTNSVTIALDDPETEHNELDQTVNFNNTLNNNKWLNAADKLLNSFPAAAGNS